MTLILFFFLYLYEIIIDGEHYKFGIANADDKMKTDAYVGDENYKGKPRRLYVQARAAYTQYGSVDTKLISYHADELRINVKSIETGNIIDEGEKRGYIGSGNSAHEKQANKQGMERSKRFKTKLR